ncbi:MAG: replication protein P [Pseudomonadales bacterium]
MDSSLPTPTELGEWPPELSTHNTATPSGAPREAVIDAVNQMFAEFALVYHNQYQKAFSDKEKLSLAKRLWLSHLAAYSPEQILAAARRATHESEYLPTVRGVLKYLESSSGLPDAYDAYREACLAPSPKNEQHWSHPAVYLAGQETGWYFLATQTEKTSRPIYERHYRALCERVAAGENLQMPEVLPLPEPEHHPMTAEERLAAVRALREKVGL